DPSPGPAAVLGVAAGRAGEKNVLVVVRIDADLIEVVRPLAADVVFVAVHPGPGPAAVFGAIHFAADGRDPARRSAAATGCGRPRARVHVFDDGVENLRVA